MISSDFIIPNASMVLTHYDSVSWTHYQTLPLKTFSTCDHASSRHTVDWKKLDRILISLDNLNLPFRHLILLSHSNMLVIGQDILYLA